MNLTVPLPSSQRPGGGLCSPLIYLVRDHITHVQLKQQRTKPQAEKGKPVPMYAISILPSSHPLSRCPGVLYKSSRLPSNLRQPGPGHSALPSGPLLTSVLVPLVGWVALRLKDPNDDDIVSILQELLDLLQGQDLLGGWPGLLDHVVDDPWEQSTRLRGRLGLQGAVPTALPAPTRTRSFPPHGGQRRWQYRIFPVGRCNQRAFPCGRFSGWDSRRRRTSWPGLSLRWRRPSPGGLGESACSAPWRPSHTRGPVSCSVHTCERKQFCQGPVLVWMPPAR